MTEQHTPGRLKVQHPHAGERGWEIAFEPGLEQVCRDAKEANARRLVACWNALEGISTEYLESHGLLDFARKVSDLEAQRDELLEALQCAIPALAARERAYRLRGAVVGQGGVLDKALAAISKAEGGAA